MIGFAMVDLSTGDNTLTASLTSAQVAPMPGMPAKYMKRDTVQPVGHCRYAS